MLLRRRYATSCCYVDVINDVIPWQRMSLYTRPRPLLVRGKAVDLTGLLGGHKRRLGSGGQSPGRGSGGQSPPTGSRGGAPVWVLG